MAIRVLVVEDSLTVRRQLCDLLAADRQRGLDAGASDYVVKGEFDQVRLLTTIRKLVA